MKSRVSENRLLHTASPSLRLSGLPLFDVKATYAMLSASALETPAITNNDPRARPSHFLLMCCWPCRRRRDSTLGSVASLALPGAAC